MDETPVFFYLPSNRTVDSVGSKSVNVRTMGHNKTHLTAVLMCLADRTKLPPTNGHIQTKNHVEREVSHRCHRLRSPKRADRQ